MGKRIYTDEIEQFIKDNSPGKTTHALAEEVNSVFHTCYTRQQIRDYMHRHNLRTGECNRKTTSVFTDEASQFLIENHLGKTTKEITSMLNDRFGTNYTLEQIRSKKRKKKLSSGVDARFKKGHVSHNKGKKGYYPPGSERSWFKKGNIPANHRPIGSESIRNKGYVAVKVAEPNVWKLKHRLLWEQYNGEIPKGHLIIFLDGNNQNLEIDNLMLISRNELKLMNQYNLKSEDAELTQTGVLVAKLIDKKNKRKNKK